MPELACVSFTESRHGIRTLQTRRIRTSCCQCISCLSYVDYSVTRSYTVCGFLLFFWSAVNLVQNVVLTNFSCNGSMNSEHQRIYTCRGAGESDKWFTTDASVYNYWLFSHYIIMTIDLLSTKPCEHTNFTNVNTFSFNTGLLVLVFYS